MWALEHQDGWALKNRCFWTVVLEKTLENPLDWKGIQPVKSKGNQSWIFIGWLMMKLQHFGYVIWSADLLEKTLMPGNIEGRRKRGWQRMRWSDGITDSMNMNLASSRRWRRTGKLSMLLSMGSQRVRYNWAPEQRQHIQTMEYYSALKRSELLSHEKTEGI